MLAHRALARRAPAAAASGLTLRRPMRAAARPMLLRAAGQCGAQASGAGMEAEAQPSLRSLRSLRSPPHCGLGDRRGLVTATRTLRDGGIFASLRSSYKVASGKVSKALNVKENAEIKKKEKIAAWEKRLLPEMAAMEEFTMFEYRDILEGQMKDNDSFLNKIPGVKQYTGADQNEALMNIFSVMTTSELSGDEELGEEQVERIAHAARVEVKAVSAFIEQFKFFQFVYKWLRRRHLEGKESPESFTDALVGMRKDKRGVPMRATHFQVQAWKAHLAEENRPRFGKERRRQHDRDRKGKGVVMLKPSMRRRLKNKILYH